MVTRHSERDLRVSPNHDNWEEGNCNCCPPDINENGIIKKEKVWVIEVKNFTFRMCQACMEEFLFQVAWHKAKGEA